MIAGTMKGLEQRPGQGQDLDLSLDQSHEPEPGVRTETVLSRKWAGASAWVRPETGLRPEPGPEQVLGRGRDGVYGRVGD